MTAAASPAEPAASPRSPRSELGDRLPVVAGVLFWVVVPLVCLAAFGLGVDRFVSHFNSHPAGVSGTFLVTTHNCQQQLCVTGGTFTSDDGAIVEPDLLGVYRWTIGTKHHVYYSADAAGVIPLPARWDPSAAVLAIVGASTLFGVWAWCVRRELRRGRGDPA